MTDFTKVDFHTHTCTERHTHTYTPHSIHVREQLVPYRLRWHRITFSLEYHFSTTLYAAATTNVKDPFYKIDVTDLFLASRKLTAYFYLLNVEKMYVGFYIENVVVC